MSNYPLLPTITRTWDRCFGGTFPFANLQQLLASWKKSMVALTAVIQTDGIRTSAKSQLFGVATGKQGIQLWGRRAMNSNLVVTVAWVCIGGLSIMLTVRYIIRTYFQEKRAHLKAMLSADESNQQEKR